MFSCYENNLPNKSGERVLLFAQALFKVSGGEVVPL